MKKEDSENYISEKKALLVLFFLCYLNDVSYDSIVLRSFGFHFDPSCNFKAIVKSKKDHIHKYVVHIFEGLTGVNFAKLDLMGNVNIAVVSNIKGLDYYTPDASLNIYLDGAQFVALGYLEGKEINYTSENSKNGKTDNLLYFLSQTEDEKGVNASADSFISWLVKLYTTKIHTDLVMGAGINEDYGAKSWEGLINALNADFYKGDQTFCDQVKHYTGKELFTSSMVLKTSGFDAYKFINHELYEFNEAKSFNDSDSTLYSCVNYLIKHKNTSVITYNYDTNLEYLLKKRNVPYVTIYDDNAFVDADDVVDIYHVHGLLPYDRYNEKKFTDSLIFNESEYYYLYNNPYSWNIAKQLHDFKFNTCIFIGISLNDPDMKRLLELAKNYLKFNFIFIKKEKEYSEEVYRDLTTYFFTFDLIVIWINDYPEIGKYLEMF